MKLTNKLLAGFTAVAVVVVQFAGVVPTLSVKADSAENMAAYEWAFDNGLTTMSSFSAFNFNGQFTREAAARFLVKGAEALGTDLSSDQTCDYSDLSSADQSLVSFINDGCDMGIFKAQDMFNPKAVMTRAQLELTIARIVYGMDEVNTYASDNNISEYAAAREMLMADDIVKVEVPANSSALRGQAALMLNRLSDIAVTPVNNGTGSTNTGTGSIDPVSVKAGVLNVALNSATLANNSQIPMAGTVRFAAVDFSAGSSDVNLKTVEIAKAGLATIPSTTRVWFEKNGIRVTGKAAFTSEGKAVLSFAPVLTVKANATEKLDLYVELSAPTLANTDFQFTSAAIDSSAVSVNGSFTTPILRTINYSVISAAFSVASIGGTSAVTANGMEIGAFKVDVANTSSETRNASFKSITLRQDGTANLASLSNIVLERNGAVVASKPIINGRDLTFSLSDTILDATTATYYIKAVVNNVEQATDTYRFTLRNSSDVNLVEANTAFRALVTPATNLLLNTYNIQGGDLTFARDTSVALSNSVAPGTSSVTLMKGTLTSNSAVTVEDPTVYYLNGLTDSGAYAKFSTVYLQIGSSTFSYSPTTGLATAASFLGTATVNGTVAVKMWATLKQTAPAGSIKFGPLSLASFARKEYVSNGNNVATAVGSIEGVNVTVESSTLNITRTDGKGDSVVAAGTSDFTVLKLNATSTQGNGVRLSRAEFTVTATGSYTNNVSLSLLVNGTVVQTKSVTTGTVFFDNFNANVTSATGATLEVKANFAEAFSAGTFKLTLLKLNAVDLLTSADVNYNMPAGATFTIGAANAEVTASNSPILGKLLLSPSTSEAIMSFRVKALNDTVRLRDLGFTGTNLSKLTNFRVVDSTNAVVATATTATDTGVTFVNISDASAPAIAKDAIATYTILADVNSDSTGSVAMTLNTAAVRASNGTTVTPLFTAIASKNHVLSLNVLLALNKLANPQKSISSSALRFEVEAKGKDSVTLDSFKLNTLLGGYDTSTAKIIVYKNDTNTIAGTTAYASGDVTVTLTDNHIVDAGTKATYIVVVKPVVGNATTQDWSVSLTNVVFNSGSLATDFNNVGGGLALTEVK